MAINVTVVSAGAHSFIADLEATLDADGASANIPHGLGVVPLDVSLCMLQVFAVAAHPNWAVVSMDATNIVCQKGIPAGSGAVGAQVRVRVSKPHSIVH